MSTARSWAESAPCANAKRSAAVILSSRMALYRKLLPQTTRERWSWGDLVDGSFGVTSHQRLRATETAKIKDAARGSPFPYLFPCLCLSPSPCLCPCLLFLCPSRPSLCLQAYRWSLEKHPPDPRNDPTLETCFNRIFQKHLTRLLVWHVRQGHTHKCHPLSTPRHTQIHWASKQIDSKDSSPPISKSSSFLVSRLSSVS